MTGIRQSVVFCRERSYKAGKHDDDRWIAPPPGTFISTTHNRQVSKIMTEGNKTFDTLAFGQVSGSFEWTFVMDYDYLEPFFLAFEDVSYDSTTKEYTFSKVNNKRLGSFCMRGKILNRMTGGTKDETRELYGCVVRALRFSKTGGASQINVTLTGFYADESIVLDDLDATDYQPYNGQLVEYSCMFIGDISDDNYVANTESISISIENSASTIYSVCSPISSEYHEGASAYTFGTTTYSNDPLKYKTRVYSGGYSNKPLRPMHKGLRPIPLINIASYNGELAPVGTRYDPDGVEDGDPKDDVLLDRFAAAYKESSKSARIVLDDTVIKSLTWQKGDGSKLQDQINSSEVRLISLVVKNSITVKGEDNAELNLTNYIWSSSNPHALED